MKIGLISNSVIFKGSIDENKKHVYNIRKIRENRLVSDVFERKNDSSLNKKGCCFLQTGVNMTDKDTTYYIELLNTDKMQKSPVAYILPLVEGFLKDEMSEDEFRIQFMDETEKTRFIFAHMDKENISSNKRVFRQELTFADKLYSLANNNAATKEALLSQIEEYSKQS